jgi:hypothetical protein
MSLDILVNKKSLEVGIVRWFKDPKFSNSYPSGPLIRLGAEEFRTKGFDLLKSHCEELDRIRMEKGDTVPVFAPAEERKYLRNCSLVTLFRDKSGQLVLVPGRFRKYALGGIASAGPESFHKLPWNCSAKEFWDCFDRVLDEAS